MMDYRTKVDPRWKEWATPTQAKYLEATIAHGSMSSAAKACGVNKSVVIASMKGLKKTAARAGYSPEHDLTHPVAPGQMLKGTSTLYKDGQPVMQWVKTNAGMEAMEEIVRAAVEALVQDVPRQKSIPAPKITTDKLCNVFTLTDSHVGALCWGIESRDPNGDWDLKIAEQVLTGCFQYMVNSCPPAKTCVVAQLGDFLNQDGILAVTPTSHHLLNADGRFAKIVQVAVRILRSVVNMALEKHEKVIVLLAEGNHDITSSIWLQAMFKALYENEPRVEVIDSVLPYYVYKHGKTMLAWHHGHLKKNDELPLLFASQFPEVWGSTTKRVVHCGHRHHLHIKEHSGMTVYQHSTLEARDAYAARGGWLSERQATALTYHSEFGQVGSVTVTPEMIEN